MNDDVACAELAAEHLLERGFSNFGYLGHRGFIWSDVRREHFQQKLAEAGKSCIVLEASSETTRRAPGISDGIVWQAGSTLCQNLWEYSLVTMLQRTILEVCRGKLAHPRAGCCDWC